MFDTLFGKTKRNQKEVDPAVEALAKAIEQHVKELARLIRKAGGMPPAIKDILGTMASRYGEEAVSRLSMPIYCALMGAKLGEESRLDPEQQDRIRALVADFSQEKMRAMSNTELAFRIAFGSLADELAAIDPHFNGLGMRALKKVFGLPDSDLAIVKDAVKTHLGR